MIHRDGGWPGLAQQEVQARLLDELRQHEQWVAPDDPDLPPDIQSILRSISENLFSPSLSVKTLKARCGIRDNNVSSRFRLQLGRSIRGYVEVLRMTAATRLLRQGDLNILTIATLVGYHHLETFHRAFKRQFESTPKVYREQVRR